MPVDFCPDCNTLRHPSNSNGQLIYSCRICQTFTPSTNALVSSIVYKGEQSSLKAATNKSIILDPSLPRKLGIICPQCHTKDPLYYQTTENDMTLTYICVNPACTRTGTLDDFQSYQV